jgi:uncharacterized protein (DUF169 family)/NAD-dependent dihydropyrimidine dehydrogenase PreA subunit
LKTVEKISIKSEDCSKCGKCVSICPNNALEFVGDYPKLLHPEMCTECGICEEQCPSAAIKLTKISVSEVLKQKIQGEDQFLKASDAITSLLGLERSPIGVALVKPGQSVPAGFTLFGSPTRHCVSIHVASLGAALYVPAEQHACAAAKAALGISELPEKVRSGKISYMHGLASSEEAAARIMAEVPRLPVGSTIGTLVAPLTSFPFPPEVIILVAKPKQAMWVANALMFETGSPRITANFAGMQASCADVTAIPIKTKEVNLSLGCYGCRSAGKLDDDEMYVGIPINKLDAVVKGLKALRRAMGKLDDVSHNEEESKKGCGN